MDLKTKYTDILLDNIKINLFSYRSLVLAFSGGLDSTVLLDLLSKLKKFSKIYKKYKNLNLLKIRAIHVNHGLNKDSDRWEEHCKQQCIFYNIELKCVKISLINKINSLEADARDKRYNKLFNNLNKEEILITAHHKNDQVETLLLSLKRGSGPNGLSGMKIYSKLNNHIIIRPLLNISKNTLLQYALNNNLTWVEDSSNKNINFDRNFIRLHILPIFKNRWPFFENTVFRTSLICNEQEQLIDELLKNDLNSLINNDGSLSVSKMNLMSKIRCYAILRRWIQKNNLSLPSQKQLICIWNEVVLSKKDSMAKFIIKDKMISRFKGNLHILYKNKKIINNNIKILWNNVEDIIILPNNIGFLKKQDINLKTEKYKQNIIELNKKLDITSPVYYNNLPLNKKYNTYSIVRPPYKGEKVFLKFGTLSGLQYIINRNKGRKLKKIWQEMNIPP